MMQIGGVDNLVLKEVKLPQQQDGDDKKILIREDGSKIKENAAEKKDDENALKAAEKEEQKAEETEKSVYGDLVGKSSDGDTTRVKKDAMEALETGMVFQKEEKEDRLDAMAVKKEDKENDLMEYNRDQLTVMLDRGDITKNEYNHEITRRDEIMEKDEKSAFAKSNAEMIEKQKEDAEKKAQEKAKERLDEMQGGGKKEENAERIENGMNKLAAGQKSLIIEEDAVEQAAKSGRSEIIDQILNPDDGGLKVVIK